MYPQTELRTVTFSWLPNLFHETLRQKKGSNHYQSTRIRLCRASCLLNSENGMSGATVPREKEKAQIYTCKFGRRCTTCKTPVESSYHSPFLQSHEQQLQRVNIHTHTHLPTHVYRFASNDQLCTKPHRSNSKISVVLLPL